MTLKEVQLAVQYLTTRSVSRAFRSPPASSHGNQRTDDAPLLFIAARLFCGLGRPRRHKQCGHRACDGAARVIPSDGSGTTALAEHGRHHLSTRMSD